MKQGIFTRSLLRCMPLLIVGAFNGVSSQTLPLNYPLRPVKIVVPSAAGGGTDIVARLLAQSLTQTLGQPFTIENKAGAGNMIGINQVAHAPADGYTLLMTPSTLVLNRILYKNLPFDPIKDFSPITMAVTVPNVLLVPIQTPVQNFAQWQEWVKASKTPLSYASAGIGTSPHMSMELLKSMTGLNLEHVAYKGTAPAMVDLMSGQVSALFANALEAMPLMASQKVKALGLSGSSRLDALPQLPTLSEAGVSHYVSIQWYGMLAPAGTPSKIIDALNASVAAALRNKALQERLNADGAQALGTSPEAFAQAIKSELEKWTRVAQSAGIEAQ